MCTKTVKRGPLGPVDGSLVKRQGESGLLVARPHYDEIRTQRKSVGV